MRALGRLAGPVLAAIWFMARSITPSPAAVLLVPESHFTIQAAVDAAADLDTVSVAAGTYRGVGNRDVDLGGKDLCIRSRGGSSQTVIDCEGLGRAFFMDRGERATIEGFSILAGTSADDVGGALYSRLATLTIRDCVFASCTARQGGGAAFFMISTVTLENCVFHGNSEFSQGGGAVWFLGGSIYRTMTCRDCVFTGNESSPGYGGAIRLEAGGSATFVGCTIARNRSNHLAGGILSGDVPIVLERSICRDNCDTFWLGGEEILALTQSVTITCSNVNLAGIDAEELILGEGVIDVDPLFCDPEECAHATTGGDYRVRSDSPCLPDGNLCGVLIGALGVGCQGPALLGACCLSTGECVMLTREQCEALPGTYQGDGSNCDSHPCQPTAVQRLSWGVLKAGYR